MHRKILPKYKQFWNNFMNKLKLKNINATTK